MMQVVTGEKLSRKGKLFEVICADERNFIIGKVVGNRTHYDHLECYSNDSSILSLEEMGFVKQ